MKPELVLEKSENTWQLFHQCRQDFSFQWHYHDECELFVPLNGQWKYLIGNIQGDIKQGQAFFLPPRLPHTFFTLADKQATPRSCYVLFFSLPLTTVDQLAGHNVSSVVQKRFHGGATFNSAGPLLTALNDMDGQETGLPQATAFLKVLNVLLHRQEITHIAQSSLDESANVQMSEKITQIGEFLSQHWQEPLTLKAIAKATHLSVPTMCRIFRRSTGRSICEYLRELRISHVQRQLLWTDHPISDIALESGFQTLGHFYRSFRETTQTSPHAYRRSVREGIQTQ